MIKIYCKYGPEIFKKLSFDWDYLISNYGRLIRVKSRWPSKVNKFVTKRLGGYNKQYLRFGIKNKEIAKIWRETSNERKNKS
jgi:hypothetical protein